MHENYRRRMMKARDPRYAKIAGKLGYGTRDMVAERIEPVEPDVDPTIEPTPEPAPEPVKAPRPAKTDNPAAAAAPPDDIAAVRDEYERVVGRRPFNGWDIPMLRQKIAEAKDED